MIKPIVFVKPVFYVSVAALFMAIGGCQQSGQSSSSAPDPLQAEEFQTLVSSNSSMGSDQRTESPESSDLRVLVYYFHPTFRCAACTFAESLVHQVIEQHWADAVDQDLLQWKPVNFESAENRPLARLFEINASAVVIASMRFGKPGEWKKIDKVWEQVKQPQAFQGSIDNQIMKFFQHK